MKPTKQVVKNSLYGGWMDGWMEGWMDGWKPKPG